MLICRKSASNKTHHVSNIISTGRLAQDDQVGELFNESTGRESILRTSCLAGPRTLGLSQDCHKNDGPRNSEAKARTKQLRKCL